MRNFMWYEMGLTYDDFYIHRVHRLGSLYKAKQRNGTENPKRPVTIAFQDYHSTEKILSSSYMLWIWFLCYSGLPPGNRDC